MIRTVDLYWAAGFLEGEGCFYSDSQRNSHSRVTAAQVQREPLDRLVSLFGGHVRGPHKNSTGRTNQPIHDWTVSGAVARGIMMTLYAMMSPRRKEQIRASLDQWRCAPAKIADRRRLATHCRNGHPYDDNHYKMRRKGRPTYRRCRTCLSAASRRYEQRLREQAPSTPSTPPGSWLGR